MEILIKSMILNCINCTFTRKQEKEKENVESRTRIVSAKKPVGALATWNWNGWIHELELLETRIAPFCFMHVSVRIGLNTVNECTKRPLNAAECRHQDQILTTFHKCDIVKIERYIQNTLILKHSCAYN